MTKFILKILLISSLFLIFSNQAFAQDWFGSVTYQISMPAGDTKDFIDETSYRGFGLDYRKIIYPNTSVGFSTGWNVFHERINETVQLKTENPGAITGLQDRTINAFPIMLSAHQYFGRKKSIRPYIGLNAGGFIMMQRFDIGIFSFEEDQWQWGIAPEIGVVVPLKGASNLIVNVKYNYAFTGDSPIGGDINHEYWTIGIGFAWSQY